MSEAASHLRVVVNPETGEQVGTEQCPGCVDKQRILDELNRKYHGALSQIGNLRADKEAEAKGHRLFPIVRRLHDLWGRATGHDGTELTAKRFDLAVPYVRNPKFGEHYIAKAIEGIAYDPICASKPNRNGKRETYNQWEHLFKNTAALQRYFDRAPVDHLAELLLEPASYPAHERNLASYMPDGATPWDGPLPADWATA